MTNPEDPADGRAVRVRYCRRCGTPAVLEDHQDTPDEPYMCPACLERVEASP